MNYKYFKILRFIFYPLYLFSFFIPRKKTIWLFGAHQNRFAENTKALYFYSSSIHNNIQAIWITGNKKLYKQLQDEGKEVCLRWSLKGLYYSLLAKYYFYNLYSDDINYYTSCNATMINLWHGIPLKQIEFDIKKGAQSLMFNSKFSPLFQFFKPYIFKNPDYVLSTAPSISKLFATAFRIKPSQCLELGYPRCDLFYNKELRDDYSYLIKDSSLKVIIYMPTWRNKNTDFINDAFPNLEALNQSLVKSQSIMYVKLHPNTKSVSEKLSNVVFLESYIDIYSFLPLTDMLITDYSSIYFDYILLGKEMLFYPFDFDDYASNDRKFYFEYDQTTPGPKVYNFAKLLEALTNHTNDKQIHQRENLLNSLWTYQDGDASKRVYEFIKGL